MFNNVLSHLHQEMFVGDVNSFMLNPMNHWLHSITPVLTCGFNR
jgi:hypothetical protein